jgi:hypothetical protein
MRRMLYELSALGFLRQLAMSNFGKATDFNSFALRKNL